MVYIGIATIGFVVTHLFDIVSIKRIPAGLKPITWFVGSGLLAYSLLMLCLAPDKLPLRAWSFWLGCVLLAMSIIPLIYSLFINLPFRKTYIETGVGDKLIKTGMYTLVRHPGVIWFIPFMLSLILVSRSSLLLIAAPIFIFLDVVLVIMQDKFFFVRMFDGYKRTNRKRQ